MEGPTTKRDHTIGVCNRCDEPTYLRSNSRLCRFNKTNLLSTSQQMVQSEEQGEFLAGLVSDIVTHVSHLVHFLTEHPTVGNPRTSETPNVEQHEQIIEPTEDSDDNVDSGSGETLAWDQIGFGDE